MHQPELRGRRSSHLTMRRYRRSSTWTVRVRRMRTRGKLIGSTRRRQTKLMPQKQLPRSLILSFWKCYCSKQECPVPREILREKERLRTPRDLVGLSAIAIVTERQYCSKTTHQALYTITEVLREHMVHDWNDDWGIASLILLWGVRIQPIAQVNPLHQKDSSTTKKKLNIAVAKINPDTSWVPDCEQVLEKLNRGSQCLAILTTIEAHQYGKATQPEGTTSTFI